MQGGCNGPGPASPLIRTALAAAQRVRVG